MFAGPEDDPEDHAQSSSAPLLQNGTADFVSEEEREAVLFDGPDVTVRGTMMDGIANVGLLLELC